MQGSGQVNSQQCWSSCIFICFILYVDSRISITTTTCWHCTTWSQYHAEILLHLYLYETATRTYIFMYFSKTLWEGIVVSRVFVQKLHVPAVVTYEIFILIFMNTLVHIHRIHIWEINNKSFTNSSRKMKQYFRLILLPKSFLFMIYDNLILLKK